MFNNGLEKDVIIKVLPRSETGMFGTSELEYDRLVIWTDKGYQKLFEKVPGILKVEIFETGHRYGVCIDPRYNLKWVMAEIEAVVKTTAPEKPKPRKKRTTSKT
jgi:hypothetical protein